MSKSFLFTDANGFYEESAGAYEEADFINVSAGVGDAGKPIVLDAGGKVDGSMLDAGDIDHGGLAGLGDDDHTQYILVDGTRAFTGDQSMGANQLTSVGDPTTATIDGASDDAVPMSFLASTTNAEGASTVGVEDAAGYYVATDVEAALAEVAALAIGPEYTVDGVGVTKGDLIHISANDTVTKSALTTALRGIGLARSTEAAAGSVVCTPNDSIITGVLTAATAGDTYYWDGSAHTATIPGTSGSFVTMTGVAKNATDLHIEVRSIKKNN
jgi:hypothetical protein